MKRKVLTILLALCVALTMMPTVAMADASTGTPNFNDGTWTALTASTTEIDGGTAGAKYFLSADVTISTSLTIKGGTTDKPVVLDLNGHVLKMNSSIYGGTATGNVIKIENSGNLILQDSNSDNLTHKFDTTNDLWVLAADGATGDNISSVTGGIITGGTGYESTTYNNLKYCHGGGVYVASGTFTMNGGNIVGCSSTAAEDFSYGGGICVNENCTLNMNGGNIIGCTAGSAAGGIYVRKGTVNMSGGNILNCTAFAYGGGGVMIASGSFTMSGGSIKYCKYTGDTGIDKGGGAIRLCDSDFGMGCIGTFTMSGGEISNCTSTNYGGGVYINDCKCIFNMTGGTIKACQSEYDNDKKTYKNLSNGVYLRGGGSAHGNQMNAEGGRIDDNVYVNKKMIITKEKLLILPIIWAAPPSTAR